MKDTLLDVQFNIQLNIEQLEELKLGLDNKKDKEKKEKIYQYIKALTEVEHDMIYFIQLLDED